MRKRSSHSINCILYFFLVWMYSSYSFGQNLDNKRIENREDFKQAKEILSTKRVPNHFSTYEKAIEYNLRVIDWVKEQGVAEDVIYAESALLATYMKLNRHSEAITLAKKMSKYSEVKNSRGLVDILYALKEAYRKSERFDELLRLLPEYYEACEKFAYPVTGGYNYNAEVAYVHFSLNNYEKAITSFKKSAEDYKQKELYLLQSSSLNDIGSCFRNLKQKDSAHYYFKKGLDILRNLQASLETEDGYVNYFGNILELNIAETSSKKVNDDVMISLYKKVLRDAKNTNEINIVIDVYYGLSRVFFNQKNLEKTFKYLDSTEIHLQAYTYPKAKINTLALKMEAHLLNGEFEKADSYFKAYRRYSDSLNKVKVDKSFMSGVLKYETDVKEKELEEVKELIKSERNVILYQKIGLASLFVLFTLSVFVFFKIRGDNKTIQQQKMVVDKALAENKILVKEIHHRVKNNLQMVSSLLLIHSKKNKDFNSKEILAQSQHQIESMSLVHEMLYQKEDIIDVPAKEYIKKITNGLLTTYPNKKIQVAISIDNISMHLDYANPIGLIVNELVTNSIKHGFKNVEEGEISIQMRKTEKIYEFVYSDNGVGMKEEERAQKVNKTFGTRLITSLVEEMNGTLKIEYDKKLTYRITFLDTKNNV